VSEFNVPITTYRDRSFQSITTNQQTAHKTAQNEKKALRETQTLRARWLQ